MSIAARSWQSPLSDAIGPTLTVAFPRLLLMLLTFPVAAHKKGGNVGNQHDFGPVLARGQTLRHEFSLTNPTNRPMRLIGAKLSTPCCSLLGPLPTDVIPPGDRREIAAFLRASAN